MAVNNIRKGLKILSEEGIAELIRSINQYMTLRAEWIKNKIIIEKNYLLMNRRFEAVANPYKIINVNEKNITKYLGKRDLESMWKIWGEIRNGGWDNNNTIPIEQYPHYRAFKKHFRHGVPWENSGIIEYHVNKNKKKKDLPWKGFETWEEVEQYYLKKYKNGQYDKLYQDIQRNGFRAIPAPVLHPCDYYVPHMMIGRNGEFIFRGEGHHRIAIAKLLELDKIPVHVYLRHKEWQKVRDDIYKNGLSEGYEDLRDHPDLQDILSASQCSVLNPEI